MFVKLKIPYTDGVLLRVSLKAEKTETVFPAYFLSENGGRRFER